ncbi:MULTISPECIES: toll/interleukin-1 receptor domain-containing protein [unclassified Nostoc]|uniref:toll/interleukin-1 receptor domain-containing protein n=1 Tax=unclassified Nostoc TaxID=2593658 RepID=UPI001C8ABBB7|nr:MULTISPECIES: toll/interleukin-1 receptor domain-containing protein [unclassified Nostoc]
MFFLIVTSDTFLKVRPIELAELAEDEKLLIQVKSVLEVISYAEEEEYYKIILKNSINGRDTWFVRKKYITISTLQDFSKHTPKYPAAPLLPSSVVLKQPKSSITSQLPQTQDTTNFWKKLLTAEKINLENIRKILGFLNDRLGNKPIELEVEAKGKNIKVDAISGEELEIALKVAQEFLNSITPGSELSRVSGDIKIEEEVIKRLQAQLQETPAIQEQSLQTVDITKDLVDCSVFSPASVTPDNTFLVQVFVHLPEQVEFVKQDAQEFDFDAKRLGVRSLGVPIQRGSELTFNLSIPKLEVDEPIQQLSWNGRASSIQFGVKVPADITQKTVIGTVTVSQNTIPLGHLKFKLSVIPSASSTSKEPQLVGEVARHYTKAFVSYSSKDRTEVLKRVQGLAVSGITVFQDILNLEPGDRWEQELYRNIDECDLFLLFWSTAAKESPWVLKEVLYALERQGSDGLRSPEIIPVIIEGPPLVPPPPELQDLHFNDKLLYLMATSK